MKMKGAIKRKIIEGKNSLAEFFIFNNLLKSCENLIF